MARIQILELPTEHHGDDMVTPFVLVIDEFDLDSQDAWTTVNDYWQGFAKQAGARCAILSDRTIDIPANTVTLDDGHVVRLKVEPDLSGFSASVEAAISDAQRRLGQALRAGRVEA